MQIPVSSTNESVKHFASLCKIGNARERTEARDAKIIADPKNLQSWVMSVGKR